MGKRLTKAGTRARRYIIASDKHAFVGRIFDLAKPLHLGFDSNEQLALYPDCSYVVEVCHFLELLTSRVESLNHVGSMLWPKSRLAKFEGFPVSRYEWLNAIADVFLMRLISVADCATILANSVCETRLDIRKCNIDSLHKSGVSSAILRTLKALFDAQGNLRQERNSRFHHGYERHFTDDDTTFKLASLFEYWGHSLRGHDRHGRVLSIERFYSSAVFELRIKFNASARLLHRQLNSFYSAMSQEFEERFIPKYRERKPLPWE